MDLYAGSERPPLFLSSQSHSSVIDKCRAEKRKRLGKNSRGPRIRRVYDSSMTNRTYKLGQSRDQASFLPPCLEDYVDRDNPVRAIDAYADALDLNELGFRDVGSDGGAGQPPYDPADLLTRRPRPRSRNQEGRRRPARPHVTGPLAGRAVFSTRASAARPTR